MSQLNFTRPDPARGIGYERLIADEAQRLAWRRAKAAERRRQRHNGYYDDQTVEPTPTPGPKRCTEDGCDNKRHARGLCGTHYRRWRRAQGKDRG